LTGEFYEFMNEEFYEFMNEVRGNNFSNDIVFSDEVSFKYYENINANSFNT